MSLRTKRMVILGLLGLMCVFSLFYGHSTIARLRYREEEDSTVGKPVYYVGQGPVKAWKPIAGPKYHVGCDPEEWRVYIRPELYYVFTALEQNHGWIGLPMSNYETNATARQKLLQSHPSVLLFCERGMKRYLELPIDELRAQGTNIAAFSDDTHSYNKFSPRLLRYFLDRTDTLVSTYPYLMKEFFSAVPLHQPSPVILWHPHSASPTFTERVFNTDPLQKIFLSGATKADSYPIRSWLHDTFQTQHHQVMDTYEHPGYVRHSFNQSLLYAQRARSYLACITTTLVHRRLVAKIFELPATGSLLLVNLDLEIYLTALGMQNRVHYVGFEDTDPESGIWWVFDPKNADQVDKIRRAGMELARSKHKTLDRAKGLNEYFESLTVPYPFPSLRKPHPCPMKGYESLADCTKAFKGIQHYKPLKDALRLD